MYRIHCSTAYFKFSIWDTYFFVVAFHPTHIDPTRHPGQASIQLQIHVTSIASWRDMRGPYIDTHYVHYFGRSPAACGYKFLKLIPGFPLFSLKKFSDFFSLSIFPTQIALFSTMTFSQCGVHCEENMYRNYYFFYNFQKKILIQFSLTFPWLT